MMQANLVPGPNQRTNDPARPRSPVERGQRGVLLAVLALTAVAWCLTILHAGSMTGPPGHAGHGGPSYHAAEAAWHGPAQVAALGMAGAGWSFPGFLAFVVAWAAMMAAMMFPGLSPMLLTVHAIARHHRGPRGAASPTAIFVGGYLLVWTLVGCAAWVLVRTLGPLAAGLGLANQAAWSPLVLGAALIVAGLYQLTPLKRACLDHCRSPFVFVMQRWRDGHGGALRMGVVHGLYCLGCCWALFTVLVAAGVMSLARMLALTLVDAAEKALPAGRRTSRAVGVALLALGVAVATRAIASPWGA
jgi:predicted metal-binding membrane protein